MMALYAALIVPGGTRNPVHLQNVDIAMTQLQKLVEGNVESITGNDWHVYLNDNGSGLPENIRAEVLIREAGVHLQEAFHGTAVFLGHGRHGEDRAVPGHLLLLAEQLFDMELAA